MGAGTGRGRRSVSSDAAPPTSFPADIVRYHGAPPERDSRVKPPDRPVFHADMDDDLLQSYLGWRRRVADRGDAEPYYGFVWLRISEIINDPLTDPDDGLEEILWMNRRFSESYTLAVLTASAAKDLCLVLGRRWPPQILWTGGYLKDAAVAEALLGDKVPGIPFTTVDRLCGIDQVHNLRQKDRAEFASVFSECLDAVVRMERTADPDLFGAECFTTRKVLLFDGFAYLGGPEYGNATVLRSDGPNRWNDIFRGLAATVFSSLHWDRRDVPWRDALLLTDRQAERVRIVLEGEPDEDSNLTREAEDWSPGVQEDDGFPLNPVVFEDMRARMNHPRKDTLKASIRMYRGVPGRRDAPFVPSGMWCASYDVMSPEQQDFYLSWRSEVLNGNYRDTDRGYLWLLLNEVVDSESEPGRRLSILTGLLRAYGPSSSDSIRGLILRTCQDYAIVTGQDPPWDGGERDASLILWVKLDVFPMGRVPLDLAKQFMDVNTELYCMADWDYEAAFNIALKAMSAKIYDKTGKTLAENMGGRSRTVYRKLFPGLSTDWGSVSLSIINARPTNGGGKMLGSAMRAAIRGINIPLGLKAPRKQSVVDPDTMDAMDAAVEAWVDRQNRARAVEKVRREAAKISLDMAAVDEAEDDLATVRELVGTEEEPEEGAVEAAPEPAEVPEEHSPWDDLADLLDETQRGYLEACLDGNGDSYARSRGTTAIRLEDAVNASAMDTVGDQVVEDGEVFGEYADDVRGIVGHHG